MEDTVVHVTTFIPKYTPPFGNTVTLQNIVRIQVSNKHIFILDNASGLYKYDFKINEKKEFDFTICKRVNIQTKVPYL